MNEYGFLISHMNQGKLTYEQLRQLENKYSLPLYIYDGDTAVQNAQEIKKCLGNSIKLCYSAKANYYLTESLSEVVDMIDICTIGEMKYCLEQHVDAGRLSFNGVWKSRADLQYALEVGVGRIVIDSVQQARNLQDMARNPVKVLLRLSSGNQFGMTADEIAQLMKEKQDFSNLLILGIHYYGGTQKGSLCQMEEAVEPLKRGLQYLKKQGMIFEELQIGGGLAVPLFYGDKVSEFQSAADYFFDYLKTLAEEYKITFECGRAIAANAGVYITRVFEKKKRNDKEILMVCGGNNHLKYFGNIIGQRHPYIESVRKKAVNGEHEYIICGSQCSANDILCKKYKDGDIEIGDYLIFYKAGAYSLQEAASLFLAIEMPKVLVYNTNIQYEKILELGWICSERRNI